MKPEYQSWRGLAVVGMALQLRFVHSYCSLEGDFSEILPGTKSVWDKVSGYVLLEENFPKTRKQSPVKKYFDLQFQPGDGAYQKA